MTDLDQELPIGESPTSPATGSVIDKLINDYAVKRAHREAIDDRLKVAREFEAIAEAKLFDELEKHNLRSVKHELGQFILSDLAWAAVTDVALARAWIDANMPEILTPNATKLAMVVREAVRGERPMPDGVDAKYTRRINWRKT